MKTYEGVLREVGQSRTNGYMSSISYVEIGDRRIKNINVYPGIESKLKLALSEPGAITLYVSFGWITGIRVPDGTLFVSDFSWFQLVFGMSFIIGVIYCLLAYGLLGVLIGPVFIPVGIFIAWPGPLMLSMRTMPGAIVI
jgi:hypothetical protein